MKHLCQRGFALLEFSLSSLTSLSLVIFFVSLCYTSLARLWLNQATYEAAICLSQGQAPRKCEVELLAKGSWMGAEAKKTELKVRSKNWNVVVDWRLLKGIELSTHRDLYQESFYK